MKKIHVRAILMFELRTKIETEPNIMVSFKSVKRNAVPVDFFLLTLIWNKGRMYTPGENVTLSKNRNPTNVRNQWRGEPLDIVFFRGNIFL